MPPSATIAAVRAARPSLPRGSFCEPARRRREATSGLDGEAIVSAHGSGVCLSPSRKGAVAAAADAPPAGRERLLVIS